MKVSDYLTWLAEAILEQVLALAWRQTVAKYGTPLRTDGSLCDPASSLSVMGKSAAWSSGMVRTSIWCSSMTVIRRRKPTDRSRSMARSFHPAWAAASSTCSRPQTNSGQLYEVDMRLRPSGASGLLVSSAGAFSRYQENEAWTWEHQALVRARVLVGSQDVGQAFEKVRAAILGKPRDLPTLRQEVSEMRAKMRDNLGTSSTAAGTGANAVRAPRRPSTSSRTPEVSSILNLWCNTRPWRGRNAPAIAALDR